MLGASDLVLCAGTMLKASFQEMVEAAVAGGFKAITVWPQDVERAHAEGLRDSDLRSMLADNGLVVADLDPLLSWFPGWEPSPEQDRGMRFAAEETFYAIAEGLGARSINVCQGFGDSVEREVVVQSFAALCDRAAQRGLIITLEFLPWSGIPDAAAAAEIVRLADRPNGTVMFDSWHYFRGSRDPEQLRAIPGARIGSVQLNDAPDQAPADIVGESMTARLVPGEGDIPVVECVRILDEIGADAPIGIEVFSSELDKLPPTQVGRICGDAGRRVLAAARS